MKTIRIFISAPEDVAEERRKADDMIASLQPRYAGQFRLVPVTWEDLPLQVDASFAQATDLVLSAESGIDVAVFVLWSQLGSAQGAFLTKGEGAERGSSTARDFDLMLSAREASAGTRPAILAYLRDDPDGFLERQKAHPAEGLEEMLHQRRLAETFISEKFGKASAGRAVRAHHVFTQPLEFAHRLRVHLREILDGLLGEGGSATWDVSEMGAPFRGLDAFEPQHAGIFFGREEEICAVQLALRRQAETGSAFVLIVGASGSGKSSLARAGVLPAVTEFDLDETVRSWRSAIFIPGTSAKDLCGGLARTLCAALPELRESDISLASFTEGLRENPALQCRLLLPKALGSGVRLFLLVDQFEEIFSHSAIGPGEQVAFITAIDALARSGSVWVLATVRADFYQQCQTLPRLMEMKGVHGQFDLLPPDADDLRRIITAPASLAGLRFERNDATGEALDRRLLDDATRHPEALPLLEYALRELFERREPDGTLTLSQYHELGGVEGALGHRAEAVFLALPVAVQAALDAVFSALVTVREDVDAGATRARVASDSAASTPERAQLIAAFVKERLFCADRDAITGESILTLSHEALLRCWPRAAEWIERNRDFLRVRARLRESVRAWTENSRATDYFLPPGKPIEDARTLLAARGDDLAPAERAYIAESVAHAEKRQRAARSRRTIAFAAMVALTLVALAGGALALIKTKAANDAAGNAERERRDAEAARAHATERAQAAEKEKLHAIESKAGADAARKLAEEKSKLAEEKTKRAWALIDYMRGPLQTTLSDKGGTEVLLEVGKLITDFYVKEKVDENDVTQQMRLWEDASQAGDVAMLSGESNFAFLELAEKNYDYALTVIRKLVQSDARNDDWRFRLSVSLGKLGDAQMLREDFKSAALSYGEALQIRRELVKRDAANKSWLLGLGVSLEKLGDVDMREAQKLLPDMRKAKLLGAAERYNESQEILKQMTLDDPQDRKSQRALGISLSKVGSNQKAQGNSEGALTSYGQAVAVFEELSKQFPGSPDLQSEMSKAFDQMGRIEQEQGNTAASAANFQQAANTHHKLVAADPENTGLQMELGVILSRLGFAQVALRDLPNAEENYTKAVGILGTLEKAGKLSERIAEILDASRENLENVRNKRRTEKK